MNRLLLALCFIFVLIVPQISGATTTPNADANHVSTWNNLTDSLNTMGQTPQQAKLTRMRLRNARATARLKAINQAKRQSVMNRS